MYAASDNNLSMFNLLLEHGADPTLENNDGETALFYTTNLTIIDTLLERGLNVNRVNQNGETPRTILLEDNEPNNMKAVEHLIQLGAIDPTGTK